MIKNVFDQGIVDEMVAGMMIRAKLDPTVGPNRKHSERMANLAFDRYGGTGITAREAAMEVNKMTGVPDPGNWRDRFEAAYSSATGSELFSGLINSSMMQAFAGSADSTKGWVAEVEVANFRENRRLRSQFSEPLNKLPRGQSAEHLASDTSTAEVYRVARYARKFEVDGQDLADADTDALTQPALTLGRGALALKLDLCFSVLLANAALADSVAMFDAAHANLNTTATLAAGTLDTSMASMRNQQENGVALDLAPQFLILPPSLEGLGKRLVRDMDGGNGRMFVRVASRLENGVTDPDSGTEHAGSGTTWYLAASGAPVIEFGYIETNRPMVQAYDLRAGRWGKGWQIKWDIGAKSLDYRGMQKNTA